MQKQKHSVEVLDPDLEMEEHLPLQEKGWVIQRVGWVAIIGVMIAGALGAFGDGLLSKRTSSSGNVKGEYERYYRYDTEMKVVLESPDHIGSISFPQQYLKKFRLVRFVPEPLNNNTLNNEVRYNFLPAENRIVTVYMVAKGYGTISGVMRVNEANNLNLNHFIYP